MSSACLFVIALAAAVGVHVAGVGPIRRDADGGAASFAEVAAASDAVFAEVVGHGGLRIASLQGALERDSPLSRAVAMLARSGPSSLGTASESDQLAFLINAYNVLVLAGVASGAPRASVRDVHGVIDPGEGFGFFVAQLFVLDGRLENLHGLEGRIRAFGDARVHAVLHCASRGCPPLGARAIRAESIEEQLDEAARVLASPPFVVVDHDSRTVRLSELYAWYRLDFEAHARSLGLLPTRLAWAAQYAEGRQRRDIARADRDGYATVTVPYDWRLATEDSVDR